MDQDDQDGSIWFKMVGYRQEYKCLEEKGEDLHLEMDWTGCKSEQTAHAFINNNS